MNSKIPDQLYFSEHIWMEWLNTYNVLSTIRELVQTSVIVMLGGRGLKATCRTLQNFIVCKYGFYKSTELYKC